MTQNREHQFDRGHSGKHDTLIVCESGMYARVLRRRRMRRQTSTSEKRCVATHAQSATANSKTVSTAPSIGNGSVHLSMFADRK
jgi:hypothetical protein